MTPLRPVPKRDQSLFTGGTGLDRKFTGNVFFFRNSDGDVAIFGPKKKRLDIKKLHSSYLFRALYSIVHL